MKVTIKLFAHFKDSRFEKEGWDLAEGTQVLQVLNLLQIEPIETMIFINGRLGSPHQVLYNGDVLSILPPMAGG